MIGIDMTKISRFKNADMELIKRILTKKEILKYTLSLDKPKFLARSWAIKEALFKANNQLSSFNKIELENINDKWTYQNYLISTTEEDDYLIAFVIERVQDEY